VQADWMRLLPASFPNFWFLGLGCGWLGRERLGLRWVGWKGCPKMLLGGLSSSLIGPERAEKTHGFGGKKCNKNSSAKTKNVRCHERSCLILVV